jgi:hypothetical protein
MVFAIWAAEGVAPADILRAIASAVMDTAAYQGGTPAAWLGLFLHFLVSFAFAAAYCDGLYRGAAVTRKLRTAGLGIADGAKPFHPYCPVWFAHSPGGEPYSSLKELL